MKTFKVQLQFDGMTAKYTLKAGKWTDALKAAVLKVSAKFGRITFDNITGDEASMYNLTDGTENFKWAWLTPHELTAANKEASDATDGNMWWEPARVSDNVAQYLN